MFGGREGGRGGQGGRAKIYITRIIKKNEFFFGTFWANEEIFFAPILLPKIYFFIEKRLFLLFYNIIAFVHLFTFKYFTIECDI